MPGAKISSKRQVTIPAASMHLAGIKALDRVWIDAEGDRIVIRRVPDLLSLEGFLGKGLSPDEEKRRMAAGLAQRHAPRRKS